MSRPETECFVECREYGWKHGVCLDASMDGRGKDGMINAIKDAWTETWKHGGIHGSLVSRFRARKNLGHWNIPCWGLLSRTVAERTNPAKQTDMVRTSMVASAIAKQQQHLQQQQRQQPPRQQQRKQQHQKQQHQQQRYKQTITNMQKTSSTRHWQK